LKAAPSLRLQLREQVPLLPLEAFEWNALLLVVPLLGSIDLKISDRHRLNLLAPRRLDGASLKVGDHELREYLGFATVVDKLRLVATAKSQDVEVWHGEVSFS